MATTSLPRLVVLNVPKAATNTYVYYKDDGSVVDGNDDVFSELVKIEIERSKADSKQVHLRFSHNNKYWQKNADDDSIVALSNKPEEDTKNPSCTLFQPTQQSDVIYLSHVPTGWRVMLNNSSRGLYVDKNSVGAPLGFLNWETLVKLPKHVAFQGDNGQYLKAFKDNKNYLQFSSSDPNDFSSGHEVSLMRDGHVRIKSDQWDLFWRMAWYSVFADSDDVTANDKATLFWPIKIDENTIALKSSANRFCRRHTDEGNDDYLHATVTNITAEARLKVQELVMERKIYNVNYRLEDTRVYGEKPYLAGTTTVSNHTKEAGSIAVTVKYTDTSSYTYTRSTTVTAGVTASITAGVPLIGEASIEVSAETSNTMEWNNTTTKSIEASATDTVPVPARSLAVVHYVGTRGTCDIPFSYTQQDKSSTDGKISVSDQIDGVFTGVNNYGFKFTVEKYQPLDDE